MLSEQGRVRHDTSITSPAFHSRSQDFQNQKGSNHIRSKPKRRNIIKQDHEDI